VQETYRPDASHYWVNEGFLYYLPKDRAVTQLLLDAAAKRGMAPGMLWALHHRGCTEQDIKPLIDVSLAESHPYSWVDGAAAAKLNPDDRFVPRLVALATRDIDARLPERKQAIYALAIHRTDESVATLRQLLADRNEFTAAMAFGAVRWAWHLRHLTKGRPLREDDFDPKYRQPY